MVQVPREQVEYMYQLIEAQRDYLLNMTEQWKVHSNLFMPICMHAHMIYLPPVFWQERDAVREAEMADLRMQLAAFQVDDDDDDTEG